MIINTNETGLIDCSGLKMWSKKADDKIRSTFNKKSSSVSLKLSPEGIAKAQSQAEQNEMIQEKAKTGNAPVVVQDFNRTGYASIDNAIIDSLHGVSDEIRQYAYDIINNDFLVNSAEHMSEDERQELVSLGLSEAQFISDNYLSGDNSKDFMEAMKKIAGIAANGVQEEDGTMDYGGIYCTNVTENGHTVQITDSVAMMKRFRPEMYEEYRSIQKECNENNNTDCLKAASKLLVKFMNELASEQPDAFKQFEKEGLEKLEQSSDKDVRDTFKHVDTKGVQNFVDALKQLQGSGQFTEFSLLTNRIGTIINRLMPADGRFGA